MLPMTRQGAWFATLIRHLLEETQHTPIGYGQTSPVDGSQLMKVPQQCHENLF